ncbi:putative phage tail protein [Mycobacteroides abscessus]|uniref:putative phage tail protein n=1 Tax=unclassified Desemzia TaxID=2685243 RepID=UPI0009A7BD4F|nr:Uncharacterized protein conserved in bacteria (DUF2313) [Mycobacteroides abscessus subsp. abscessus]
MIRDINLIEHLPPFLQNFREFVLITNTEDLEFQAAADESERIKDNQFILSADEQGIQKFERILNIHVSKDEQLQTRRSRVMSRWNDISPYTYHALVSKLISLHNSENFIINRDYNKYEIEIITHLEVPGQVDELDRILDYIMPVNLVVDSKNRIYCNAEGNIYAIGGFAYASIIELSDAYQEYFQINGNYSIGGQHSINAVIELSDSYNERYIVHGKNEVGSVLNGGVTVVITDAYNESFSIDGRNESGMNLGNVQIISTE